MLLRRTLFLAAALVVRPAAAAPPPIDQSIHVAAPSFTFQGTVLDASAAPVTGASVIVIREGTAAEAARSMVTDEQGRFSLPLAAGDYVVTIAADGFAPISERVTVAGNSAAWRQFTLSIAGVRETVNVTARSRYQAPIITSGTKTSTPLRDVPQSITVITRELVQDRLMSSVADAVRYVPGITAHQGENNRDQIIIRGNNSSADFFVDGVRDDVQHYRDLYNLERIEALKGPNAMIFGRGGGGGVVNRVTKSAGFAPSREITLMGGAFENKRVTADVNQPMTKAVALRVNGVYENSGSFRPSVDLERYGVNPSLALTLGPRTRMSLGYEHFRDDRTADRGIPSFAGRPIDSAVSSYFGNPDDSFVRARVDVASASVEHRAAGLTIHERTVIGGYGRAYQNYVPGEVNAGKTLVALSAYNNNTERLNIFNQADVTYSARAGGVRHTLLTGAETGKQLTDNFRNTGYFNNVATSVPVSLANPSVRTPVTFRQSATDANNHVTTNVAAAYMQDQIELSRHVQAIAGLRFDRFDLQYHNNRNGDDLRRVDHLLSPRAGVVIKPTEPVSLYGSYTVSYLPSSGDQFSSLTTITQQVKPERFKNYEAGAKWDIGGLALTAAVYRLDRSNTPATDPNDPTRIVQTGSQRTNGTEISANGRIAHGWQIAGGYAYQHALVTSATVSARAGAEVAQVPRHTLSLWNLYQVHRLVGAGLGVVYRTDMFAAIDNSVVLPGYTDVDAAVYVSLTPRMRLQANLENLFDTTYFVNADNNTNISSGSPRALRIALVARF